jgi:hypothetical protein
MKDLLESDFGGDEEAMALSSKIVTTVRPDIDINFGCPVKKVVCSWCWCAKRCGFDDSFN